MEEKFRNGWLGRRWIVKEAEQAHVGVRELTPTEAIGLPSRIFSVFLGLPGGVRQGIST